MTLNIRVIAPDKVVWDAEAEEIILPSSTGQLGILTGHIPLLTALDIGVMRVRINKEWKPIILLGGFAEVNNNRLPLVLGIGGNNTANIIDEIKSTDLSRIDAILSVSPYYSKPTQEGVYQHFKAISEASPKPIILYNVPGRTSSNILPTTIIRLAKDYENIIAVKEAAGDIRQYFELLSIKPKDFMVISGDDDLALGVALAGGSGVISVIGQALPKEFSEMIRMGIAGRAKDAYEIYYKLMPMIGLIFSENNPAGIKAVLEGVNISNSHVRLPLVEATDKLKAEIAKALNILGKS